MLRTRQAPTFDRFTLLPSSCDTDLRTGFGAEHDVGTLLALIDSLQGRVADLERLHHRLMSDYRHLDEQVREAGRIQQDMLPAGLGFSALDVHTLFRPIDRISGDLFDIVRFDDNRFGISLADVSGHGLPAAVLSLTLRRCFSGRMSDEGACRILPPDEVLLNVNREVLASNFTQCQFVGGLHAVYDESQRRLTFARGGLPYPIVARPGEVARQLVTAGPIIGAFEDAQYETCTIDLSPGDTIVFYTDGLEALLVEGERRNGCNDITDTSWFAGLATLPLQDSIDHVATRLTGARKDDWPADDVSIIALRVCRSRCERSLGSPCLGHCRDCGGSPS